MKITSKQIWAITGGVVMLAVSFSLGYVVGHKTQRSSIETSDTLTPKDMEHAFASIQPTDPEPMPQAPADHESMQQEQTAMSLSSLVSGLEKKVAANPENIDQQLLLAQTYKELDNRPKSLSLLRSLNKQAPKNAQVKITLATILMTGTDKQELKDALVLFDEAIKLKPDVASMARMYQGEIRVKLGNNSKQ
jgi:cytochrome c-type biogenesis protein CcmH/NrfG